MVRLKAALDFGSHEDRSEYNDAYSNLRVSTLVQESKIFNEKQISDRKCIDLLNKIIFLLNQGEIFPDLEKSTVFFNVTKLFQVNSPGSGQSLRRLIYVFIKELKANENEVFVVISCLTKDVAQNENEMYKANALRVLTKIIDDQYVQQLEKYLKQALIDKSNHVVSAALVSLINLYKKGGHSLEIVKKSINEVQDKLINSGDGNLQYQALLILFELKKNDLMATMKLLLQMTQTKIFNTITKCQLIRYIKSCLVMNPTIDPRTIKQLILYMETCLQKEEDAVQFEAAKTMCELFEIFGNQIDVETPFQVLTQLASNASKPVNKYGALRVMNRIASKQPMLVGICQSELENLITDMNRSVASLAISTLLKTCNEDSVSKLLKQISHYLPDLGIDFKIEIIQSIQLLYQRIPQKADVLLKFLTDCLKDEGNVAFRESVVNTIMFICPQQREMALMILAEHIEDCEHTHVQTKILSFLSEEGPKSKNPSSYIRFIYNRINLEKAVIRAAAVTSLATFAQKVPLLKKSILVLLYKCLKDSDDEVRERSYFFIQLLEDQKEEEIDNYRNFVFDNSQEIDIDALQDIVLQKKDDFISNGVQIDLAQVMESRESIKVKQNTKIEEKQEQIQQVQQNIQIEQVVVQDKYLEQMNLNIQVQEIISEQDHIFSSSVQALNDQGSEYVIKTVKHFFTNQIIVQYIIQNTIEEQILSKVNLKIEKVESTGQSQIIIKGIVSLNEKEEIKYGEEKYVYVIIDKSEGEIPQCKMKQKLQIKITEIDIDSKEEMGSYEEDYQIDELVIGIRDYMQSHQLSQGQFKDIWDAIGSNINASEIIQTFQLPFKSMEDAVKGIIKLFGMSVCDNSDQINVTEKVHNLYLSGLFYGQETILIRGQLGFNQDYGCVFKIYIRSLNQNISNTLLECIN